MCCLSYFWRFVKQLTHKEYIGSFYMLLWEYIGGNLEHMMFKHILFIVILNIVTLTLMNDVTGWRWGNIDLSNGFVIA